MRSLPNIETLEQAKEALRDMDEHQEIRAELDEWKTTIEKHNDGEFSASFADMDTGVISLLDASQILLEHGDHDLYLV